MAPPSKLLKKYLLQIFLSALIYNASATIKYLEMRQQTKKILLDLFEIQKSFKTPFE